VASDNLNSVAEWQLLEYQEWSPKFARADGRVLDAINDCVESERLSTQRQQSTSWELQTAIHALTSMLWSGQLSWPIADNSTSNLIQANAQELQQFAGQLPQVATGNAKESLLESVRAALTGIRRRVDRLDNAVAAALSEIAEKKLGFVSKGCFTSNSGRTE
jgi:hypothetical protein